MTKRMLVAIKRRADLGATEFRDCYETGHSRIAVRLFGHLWSKYRRHYVHPLGRFALDQPETPDDPVFPYDVIAELVFKDDDGIDAMARIFADHQDYITADERRTFDRKDCWLLACDTIEEPLTPRPDHDVSLPGQPNA